jgi:hypothetical protein
VYDRCLVSRQSRSKNGYTDHLCNCHYFGYHSRRFCQHCYVSGWAIPKRRRVDILLHVPGGSELILRSVGMMSSIVPTYLSEVSPANARGRMVASYGILAISGYVWLPIPLCQVELTKLSQSPHGRVLDVTLRTTRLFNGDCAYHYKLWLHYYSSLAHRGCRSHQDGLFSKTAIRRVLQFSENYTIVLQILMKSLRA